jgi:hypothetical protein
MLMKRIRSAFYAKLLAIYLGTALIVVSAFAGPAEAMFVPAAPPALTTELSGRTADLATIQRALESRALQQRLMDYGLAPGKTMAKINGLSDGQVHRLAANINALQAGGRGIDNGTVIIILLLLLLIIILVQNTGETQANLS